MDEKKKKQLALQFLFFVVVMGLTFVFVFRDQNLDELKDALQTMKLSAIFAAIMIAVFFVGAEGCMIYYLLRGIGGISSLSTCIKCSFIGFFFSGITPSATGGQPMQLYYLRKAGNPWSLSSVVLMTVALVYKFVLIVFGVGIWIFWNGPLKNYLGMGYYRLFLLGLFLNTALVAVLLMAMFTPSLIRFLAARLEWVLVKLHILKKAGSTQKRLNNFMDSYQDALRFLQQHKEKILVVFFATVIQRTAVFALTYVVYRGLGFQAVGLTTIMWLQASVYIAVDMLPIPGAQGITEAMYKRIFLPLFTSRYLMTSLVITRGISFYLMIVLSLIIFVISYVRGEFDLHKDVKDGGRRKT